MVFVHTLDELWRQIVLDARKGLAIFAVCGEVPVQRVLPLEKIPLRRFLGVRTWLELRFVVILRETLVEAIDLCGKRDAHDGLLGEECGRGRRLSHGLVVLRTLPDALTERHELRVGHGEIHPEVVHGLPCATSECCPETEDLFLLSRRSGLVTDAGHVQQEGVGGPAPCRNIPTEGPCAHEHVTLRPSVLVVTHEQGRGGLQLHNEGLCLEEGTVVRVVFVSLVRQAQGTLASGILQPELALGVEAFARAHHAVAIVLLVVLGVAARICELPLERSTVQQLARLDLGEEAFVELVVAPRRVTGDRVVRGSDVELCGLVGAVDNAEHAVLQCVVHRCCLLLEATDLQSFANGVHRAARSRAHSFPN
mmetsp:Transcript_57605/g.184997  ORF Transcript_57605/g.184997 Transcript_57605/m.184997 type:complete len:366 (-) Transcript_57605:2269-3366(-)